MVQTADTDDAKQPQKGIAAPKVAGWPPGKFFTDDPRLTGVALDLGAGAYPSTCFPSTCTVKTLGFEPIPELCLKGNRTRQIHMVRASVANFTGFSSSFRVMGGSTYRSSSLMVPAKKGTGMTTTDHKLNVAVLSFEDVLNIVPEDLPILFVKMNLAGFDFETIRSAGEGVRRISFIKSEVMAQRQYAFVGASNDLCRDWLPFMRGMHFELLAVVKPGPSGLVSLFEDFEESHLKYCSWEHDQHFKRQAKDYGKGHTAFWRNKNMAPDRVAPEGFERQEDWTRLSAGLKRHEHFHSTGKEKEAKKGKQNGPQRTPLKSLSSIGHRLPAFGWMAVEASGDALLHVSPIYMVLLIVVISLVTRFRRFLS